MFHTLSSKYWDESQTNSCFGCSSQYGTKALDKIAKAILGQIESKVPPPKDYPGGDAMFFRGKNIYICVFLCLCLEPWCNQTLSVLDMKHGMIDVGMLCTQSRLGINTEKGEIFFYFIQRKCLLT